MAILFFKAAWDFSSARKVCQPFKSWSCHRATASSCVDCWSSKTECACSNYRFPDQDEATTVGTWP